MLQHCLSDALSQLQRLAGPETSVAVPVVQGCSSSEEPSGDVGSMLLGMLRSQHCVRLNLPFSYFRFSQKCGSLHT